MIQLASTGSHAYAGRSPAGANATTPEITMVTTTEADGAPTLKSPPATKIPAPRMMHCPA